jgi:FtsP/CotA-like multicopper oxidase with cupredoxin domain
MTRLTSTRRRLGLLAAATLAMSSMSGAATVTAVGPPPSGIVCTSDAGANPSFTLHAVSGYVSIPDGNTIYMWSYSDSGSTAFQLPGPTLCVNQGDNVTVTLVNDLAEPVSIVFPGQTGVQANGSPAEPQLSGSEVTSLVQPALPGGGTMTYTFTASEPGTYIYESGTDPVKQVQMGLYGALAIRPAGHADWAYDDVATKFKASTEYVMLLSEVDPDLHQAIERGQSYDFTTLHPRYWMINGRSFPDTIAPNGAAWLPNQPYSAMVHVEPYDAGSNPNPALIRYLNVGGLNHPFHPHGNHGRVIARDGRLLEGGAGEDLSYEKFTVLVGSGQTWDTTFKFTDEEGWNPSTNPIPVTIPQPQNIIYKGNATWYSGSPYLGVQDELPVGVTSFNECGEFYHVAHSHALNEAANYDAGFGGMLTLIRIDPSGGC